MYLRRADKTRIIEIKSLTDCQPFFSRVSLQGRAFFCHPHRQLDILIAEMITRGRGGGGNQEKIEQQLVCVCVVECKHLQLKVACRDASCMTELYQLRVSRVFTIYIFHFRFSPLSSLNFRQTLFSPAHHGHACVYALR